MTAYRRCEVARRLGMSADTLRYYEKIGLLPRVARNGSGVRRYARADLARQKFIQRARLMNFSLDEIKNLLQFRSDPSDSKAQVRELTRRKLDDIGARVDALQALRQELDLLMDSCTDAGKSCPIIDGIEDGLREDAD
jgi:DNA-binding transcriptional MerR regulator